MQALCPQCSQKIVIDDAKVPDRAFNVRCPRCQTVVKLQGKGGANEAGAAPPALAPPPVAQPSPAAAGPTPPPPTPLNMRPGPDASGSHSSDEMRAHMMAQVRREMASGEVPTTGQSAFVAFPDPAQAAAITLTLTRLGYQVETVDDFDDGSRLLDMGVYNLVATARVAAAQGRPETVYQRLARYSPDQRRGVFVVLVGDEFKTGDGTQAFLVLADLVVNSRDAGAADPLIRITLGERKRLYKAYDEARKRFDAAGL